MAWSTFSPAASGLWSGWSGWCSGWWSRWGSRPARQGRRREMEHPAGHGEAPGLALGDDQPARLDLHFSPGMSERARRRTEVHQVSVQTAPTGSWSEITSGDAPAGPPRVVGRGDVVIVEHHSNRPSKTRPGTAPAGSSSSASRVRVPTQTRRRARQVVVGQERIAVQLDPGPCARGRRPPGRGRWCPHRQRRRAPGVARAASREGAPARRCRR